MAKNDLLSHYFLLFCGEHNFLITLPRPKPPSIHYNALQFLQNEPQMHCFVSLKSCSPHNNKKKWLQIQVWQDQQRFFKSDMTQPKFLSWGNIPIWVGFPKMAILPFSCHFKENIVRPMKPNLIFYAIFFQSF